MLSAHALLPLWDKLQEPTYRNQFFFSVIVYKWKWKYSTLSFANKMIKYTYTLPFRLTWYLYSIDYCMRLAMFKAVWKECLTFLRIALIFKHRCGKPTKNSYELFPMWSNCTMLKNNTPVYFHKISCLKCDHHMNSKWKQQWGSYIYTLLRCEETCTFTGNIILCLLRTHIGSDFHTWRNALQDLHSQKRTTLPTGHANVNLQRITSDIRW